MREKAIDATASESGIVATLIHHPDFVFHSESLKPNHFSISQNRIVYQAIKYLAESGITNIDPYNIMEVLEGNDGTKREAQELTVDGLYELIEASNYLARHTPEEYLMLVSNVLDASFRTDALRALKSCEGFCYEDDKESIEQKIYDAIDSVMVEYSSVKSEVPEFKDVVDECWEEIKSRQGNGYAGIPFKFNTLNEYATIEKGELFIFAAEAKQGKSMMLLNCAVDLLKKDLRVLYLDSELNTRLFTARLLSHLTGIKYKKLTSGCYTDEERQRIDSNLEWIKTRKFSHVYMPMFDIQSIYTTVKKVSHTQGIDVLIVDYFKGSGEGTAWDSYSEMGRFVDMVKNRICGDMSICGIGAAQATSTGKVADSAKIGRNASTIALIEDKTPEEIAADGEECGNKKLRVVLNRNGMQHASGEYIDLRFDGDHILYEEAKQHAPVEPPF